MSAATDATAIGLGRRTIAVMVLIPVVVTLALCAFAWPAARTAPRDLPLGVAGPAAATAAVEQGLARHEGAFEVHRYEDAAAARAAVEDRDVYGAVVVTPRGTELLTASAASPVVAGLLREAVSAQAPAGTTVPVTDVVAAPAGDPRGAVLASTLLPLTLAGAAAGVITTLLGLRGGRAVATLSGAAMLAGLVGATLADTWLGALNGNWWAEAGILGLTVLAIGATFAGLAALLGKPGLGVGALLMVLIGNPFSGVSSAPELLPTAVGTLGQWLPPGAGGSALRSVSSFGGAAAGGPLLVLALWAAAGLTATLLGARRRRAVPETAPVQAPVPVPVSAG
ncbi:ABC transporter permease [Streptomyces sp. NPDC002122]|uniref:ABC transporter permease n=1 Tax=Streptomyces sp. NPDC002122 TaxID=3154407 RepID=UPI003330F322